MLSVTESDLFNMLSTNRINWCFLLWQHTAHTGTHTHTHTHMHIYAYIGNAVPRVSIFLLVTWYPMAIHPGGQPGPTQRDPSMTHPAFAGIW